MFTALLFHVQVLVMCEWNRLDCSAVNRVTSFWCREEAHLQPPTWHTAGSDHAVGVRQPYPVFRCSSGEPSASTTYWWNLCGCHHTICWFVQVSNLSTILSKILKGCRIVVPTCASQIPRYPWPVPKGSMDTFINGNFDVDLICLIKRIVLVKIITELI